MVWVDVLDPLPSVRKRRWFWGVYHISVILPYLYVQCIYIYIYYDWTRNDLLLECSTPQIEKQTGSRYVRSFQ